MFKGIRDTGEKKTTAALTEKHFWRSGFDAWPCLRELKLNKHNTNIHAVLLVINTVISASEANPLSPDNHPFPF